MVNNGPQHSQAVHRLLTTGTRKAIAEKMMVDSSMSTKTTLIHR